MFNIYANTSINFGCYEQNKTCFFLFVSPNLIVKFCFLACTYVCVYFE